MTTDRATTLVGDGTLSGSALDHTLPGRLLRTVEERPDAPALLQKELGIYRRYTWRQYRDTVAAIALALTQRGVGTGDVVAILSDNRVEWVFADLATQALGAITCGIYPTNSGAEVGYLLGNCRAKLVVVEDQEQVDKVLAVRDELPDLRDVVIVDPRGTRGYPADLLAWDDLLHRGEAALAGDPSFLERHVDRLEPDAAAVLIYTSGTTAAPKGALWSHRVITVQADRFLAYAPLSGTDTVLSYLPLCHGAEKVTTQLVPLSTGATVHFGESIGTVQRDLVEVGPTIFLGMPRIWEKMRAGVEGGLRRSSRLKRWVYARCLGAGRRLVEREVAGTTRGLDQVVRRVIDLLAFRALREHLGLGRAWFVFSGGAPIAPDLLHWVRAIGLPIVEGFGQTEAGMSHMCPLDAPPRIGTVGLPLAGIECRIAEDGEILLRSDSNFLGYLDAPEATAQTLSADGWIHTGDLGELDEAGYLRIIGRKKQIIITSGGKNISPASIENELKASPYIAQAVPLGDARPFIGALIQLDLDTVGDWAAERRIAFTSFEDLAARPEVVRLLGEEVERANERLARVSQVRGFRLLPKPLHQDDGELTATQKVRREVVLDRFADLVDDIYGRW